MAFKSMKSFEEDRFGYFLRLASDEESVNAVFLYHNTDEVLMADVHYINSKSYKGYVHCCGDGCPACQKGIRVQQKLFVPVLLFADINDNYNENTVLFWDRTINFNRQLQQDVFRRYDCPEDYIFRITRHGGYRDLKTTYSIIAKMNCNSKTVDDTLKAMGVSFPDYYENVVKSVGAADLYDMLSETVDKGTDKYMPSENFNYEVKPRKTYVDPATIVDTEVPEAKNSVDNGLGTFDPNDPSTAIGINDDVEIPSVKIEAEDSSSDIDEVEGDIEDDVKF